MCLSLLYTSVNNSLTTVVIPCSQRLLVTNLVCFVKSTHQPVHGSLAIVYIDTTQLQETMPSKLSPEHHFKQDCKSGEPDNSFAKVARFICDPSQEKDKLISSQPKLQALLSTICKNRRPFSSLYVCVDYSLLTNDETSKHMVVVNEALLSTHERCPENSVGITGYVSLCHHVALIQVVFLNINSRSLRLYWQIMGYSYSLQNIVVTCHMHLVFRVLNLWQLIQHMCTVRQQDVHNGLLLVRTCLVYIMDRFLMVLRTVWMALTSCLQLEYVSFIQNLIFTQAQ